MAEGIAAAVNAVSGRVSSDRDLTCCSRSPRSLRWIWPWQECSSGARAVSLQGLQGPCQKSLVGKERLPSAFQLFNLKTERGCSTKLCRKPDKDASDEMMSGRLNYAFQRISCDLRCQRAVTDDIDIEFIERATERVSRAVFFRRMDRTKDTCMQNAKCQRLAPPPWADRGQRHRHQRR